MLAKPHRGERSWSHEVRFVGIGVGATALATRLSKRKQSPRETTRGAPSMSISMETNTAAIYLRRSTEDDGKSVGQQERTLRNKAEDLAINIVAVYSEDEAVA